MLWQELSIESLTMLLQELSDQFLTMLINHVNHFFLSSILFSDGYGHCNYVTEWVLNIQEYKLQCIMLYNIYVKKFYFVWQSNYLIKMKLLV